MFCFPHPTEEWTGLLLKTEKDFFWFLIFEKSSLTRQDKKNSGTTKF